MAAGIVNYRAVCDFSHPNYLLFKILSNGNIMKHFSKTYCLLLLLILPVAVNATPFHIIDQSAYQGGSVTLSLFDDSTTNLEAATLRITYDPSLLSYSAVSSGNLTYASGITLAFDALEVTVDSAKGFVDVSLATSDTAPVDSVTGSLLPATGSLFSVTFNVFSYAAISDTYVSIECLNWDPANLTPCIAPTSTSVSNDYYVPNTIGKVTILEQTTAVPEPGIILLMLVGFLGFNCHYNVNKLILSKA